MTYEALDVVAVPFPFSDRAVSKRRPALVVSSPAFNERHDHLVLAMVTTAAGSSWPSDIAIRDLAAAGLRVASVVRLKLFTLDVSLVLRRVGNLSPLDAEAMMAALAENLIAAGGETRH